MNKIYNKISNANIRKVIEQVCIGCFVDVEFSNLDLLNDEDSLVIVSSKDIGDVTALSKRKNPKLIINETTDDSIFNKMYETFDNTKVIVYPLELNVDFLIDQINSFSNLPYSKNKDNLFKISIIDFLSLEKKNDTEVYIKLGIDKYVKISKQGELDSERILSYTEKGMHDIYIQEPIYKDYIKKHFLTFIHKIERQQLSIKGQSVQQKVYEAFHSLGLREEQKILVDNTIKENMGMIKKNKNLADFLDKMESQDNFLSDHTFFTMYLSAWICSLQGFHHDQTIRKICLAAFFHDMSLNSKKLVHFNGTKKELEKKYLGNEKMNLLMHPIRSAEILKDFLDLPDDASHIIREHHERPDGKGFPTGKSGNFISPLSCIFIIAHEVSHRVDYGAEKISAREIAKHIMDINREGYNTGNFRKPMERILLYFESKRKEIA